MTLGAGNAVVRAAKTRRRHVMASHMDLPILRHVTARAQGAQLPAMNIGLRVAGPTFTRGRFELDRFMTVGAAHLLVFSLERPVGKLGIVVVKQDLAVGIMAALTVGTELPTVHIVLLV